MKAWASEDYLKEKATNPEKRIQTFQFFKGNHFKGKSVDAGVDELSFNDLIYDLAQHLVKQNFYLARNLAEGDLLIVVHYGVTDFEEDQMELLGINSLEDIYIENPEVEIGSTETFDVSDALNSSLAMQEAVNSGNSMTRAEKAQILGIENMFDRPSHLSWNYEYEQMMEEARYFVVLMAYDYQLRRKGESKLLWSTRYNIRSSGQSFDAAIKQMNAVSSDYFGKNFKKLTRKRLDDDSEVVIGEIELIESETPETDSN